MNNRTPGWAVLAAIPFLSALSGCGARAAPAVASAARPGPEDAAALMKRAAGLEAAGRYDEAGVAYGKAGAAYEAAGRNKEWAAALSKSATMYEKEADQLLAGGAGHKSAVPPTDAAPPPAAPVRLAGARAALPRLAARPHYIIGRAVFEDGRPVPDFVVNAAGMNGKFDVMLNVKEGATSFGEAKGHNGVYAMQVESSHLDPLGKRDPNEDATIFSVTAKTTLHYNGTIYGIPLRPVDGIIDGSDPGGFRGNLSRGIVRDFVVKMSGLKPGYKAAEYPDHGAEISGTQARFAYYGGGLDIDCTNGTTQNDVVGRTSVSQAFPKGSTVALTLQPTQPLLDGSQGRTLTRSSLVGPETSFYSIPFGLYTATAKLTEPNGTTHALRWKVRGYDPNSPFLDTMLIQWTPLVNDFDKSGEVIVPKALYLLQ